MKYRMGFVSNSSSTSFCLIGFEMDPPDLEELKEMLTEEAWEAVEKDELYGLDEKFGISWEANDDDTGGVGIWFDMADDETWKQAKERAREALSKVFTQKVMDDNQVTLIYGSHYS